MAAPKKYPDELRERATRLAGEGKLEDATIETLTSEVEKFRSTFRAGDGTSLVSDEVPENPEDGKW